MFWSLKPLQHLLCKRPEFDPWVGKILWRREWQHSSILAWRIPCTRSLAVYSLWGDQQSDTNYWHSFHFVVQSLSRVWLFVTTWTAASQASLSFISRSLLTLMSIELVMPSNHLILCCPFLLLPSIFPSIRVFSSELALPIRWPQISCMAGRFFTVWATKGRPRKLLFA